VRNLILKGSLSEQVMKKQLSNGGGGGGYVVVYHVCKKVPLYFCL